MSEVDTAPTPSNIFKFPRKTDIIASWNKVLLPGNIRDPCLGWLEWHQERIRTSSNRKSIVDASASRDFCLWWCVLSCCVSYRELFTDGVLRWSCWGARWWASSEKQLQPERWWQPLTCLLLGLHALLLIGSNLLSRRCSHVVFDLLLNYQASSTHGSPAVMTTE